MTTPFLIADAAEVAVMSPLAEAAFGSYDLQVPDGIDIEDIHDFEAPGNELGYVARLSPQRATGIARRFIRADVAVTAKDDTDPDVIPESDVDRVLSEAESRVESEFFLESDITKAGLGAWVPYVDFNVGDIVNVRIFDIWVSLPVTRIEPIISEGDVVDWRVHVGGQLLSDDQAREVENATIQKELIQDRRDLAGIDAKATKAVKDSSEAKTVADEAKQATANNRTYIDEQLDLAGAAVEQGRQYLESMRQYVAAGTAQAGLAQSMASEANSYAQQAIDILDQLDPLRDDVVAAHAEVTRLHNEASQFTDQAAEHVRQASQHAADAVASASSASQHAADGKSYAEQALAHEEEGARQAGLAADSASAALQNADRAQGIVDDANGLLSQVEGYSQEAKDALADAESLLANAGGSGKSLGDVLLEVAQKHQETLTAHGDILDLHGEVLQKHGEAINYVAVAAAQAGTAAMHASMAAQEALEVATNAARAASSASDAAADAAAAASSAGQAADEAAQAASNNSAAIGKLQEADGKLQEADQKLQDQIDILEESQRLLAKAVSLLSAGVAQAAAAARNAGKAAKSAGDAAGKALDALEARNAAGEAWQATQEAIDAEQNDLIAQLKSQQDELVKMQNESVNMIMATQAGTSFPGVNVRRSTNGTHDWEFTIPDTKGALAKVEFWQPASGGTFTLNETQIFAVTSSGQTIRTYDGRFAQVTWAKPRAIQRDISELSTTAVTPSQSSWITVSDITVTAANRASQGYLLVKARWSNANRGSTYGIRLVVNGVAQTPKYTSTLGPLTFLGDGQSTFTVDFSNVSVPANRSVQVQVYSTASSSSARRVNRVELTGSWIETQ